jgi:transposase
MAGLPVKVLLADRGYDANHVADTARTGGSKVVIPSKRSRMEARSYDREQYKKRHLIEHVFRWLNQWRDSATCYALAMLNALIPILPLSLLDVSPSPLDDTS